MHDDPALTTLAVQMCTEVDNKNTATQDGFVRYDIRSEKVLGLKSR